VVAELVQ
jgi:hypothetical protein